VSVDVVPTVSIAALTAAKSNPSLKLLLTGTVGPADLDVDVDWSLVSGGLASGGALADTASTAVTGSFAAGVTGTMYLVLPAGSLTAGATYQFQLSASYTDVRDATPGYSALTVTVNSPPSSGTLALDPRDGVVMETAFDYACAGWVDDATDLPLLYSFFYALVGAEETEYQLVSKTPSTGVSAALLPQGGGNASEVRRRRAREFRWGVLACQVVVRRVATR
jgi:hypothetical protein